MLTEVNAEAMRSWQKYGQIHSTHEGLGVITEEFWELVEAVRSNDREAIRREAIQVSAAALRLAQSADLARDDFCKRSGFRV